MFLNHRLISQGYIHQNLFQDSPVGDTKSLMINKSAQKCSSKVSYIFKAALTYPVTFTFFDDSSIITYNVEAVGVPFKFSSSAKRE